MIYVFDTSSLSALKHFYPVIFKSIWTGLDDLVQQQKLISTREVWNEMERGNPDQHTNEWLKTRKEYSRRRALPNCNLLRRYSRYRISKALSAKSSGLLEHRLLIRL